MERPIRPPGRRGFLKASAALGAAAGLAPLGRALAADAYPDHAFRVVVPTRQGGAAERLARTFSQAWRTHLGADFEFSYYPGASGQVGYELYLGKDPHDAYHLLFGNMGPEMIMYVIQKPPYKYPQDYIYFCRLEVDDSAVFVPKGSPYKTIEQLVDDAKKQTIPVATSRLPHPASIGMLALAEATKAKFNLVPYGGGNPTSTAVITSEVPCGVLPASVPIRLSDQVRILGVFSDENKLSGAMGGAPSVNKVFGTRIPDLPSAHAWAIHRDVLDKYPERYAKLDRTAKSVFGDPAFKAAYVKTKAPWEEIQYGDRQVCHAYAEHMVELANRYRGIISASRK
jgi:tripartite-type tricarboxylate transporter receptor subunit TctC